MKNIIQPGDVINVTPAADLASGAGYLIGGTTTGILGVALAAITAATVGAVAVRGVVELAKLTTDVVVEGSPLYWDDTNKRLTLVSTNNSFAGHAVAAAGNGVTTAKVLLNV